MNIHDIKTKAKSVLVNRKNIIYVFIFISIISVLANYISQVLGVTIPFLPLLISIIMLPFSHGNIVTALKTVNECGDEVTIENEGLVGIKRFKELFFTYFIQTAFLMVVIMLICLVLFLVAKLIISGSNVTDLGVLFSQVSMHASDINAYINDQTFINAMASLGGIVMVGIVIIAIVAIIYSLTFALTPYVLEKYKIYGAKAMSESARLMKGHKGTLLALYFSYLGWFILTVLISVFIEALLPIPLLAELVMSVLTVYLFSAEMNTSVAVLFEEIDLEDKKNI